MTTVVAALWSWGVVALSLSTGLLTACTTSASAPTGAADAASSHERPGSANDGGADTGPRDSGLGPIACGSSEAGGGCGCTIGEDTTGAPSQGPTVCTAAVVPNGICCADESWPTIGGCSCGQFLCDYNGGDCFCSTGVHLTLWQGDRIDSATTSCTGALCCTTPGDNGVSGPSCGCYETNSAAQTCMTTMGGTQVAACGLDVALCPARQHVVSVCSTGQPVAAEGGKDAGVVDAGVACPSHYGGGGPATVYASCGGTCVNIESDVSNCGGCGVQCSAPTPACSNGSCVCVDALTLCNGVCIQTGVLGTDPANCGGCGMACPAETDAGRPVGCIGGKCMVQ